MEKNRFDHVNWPHDDMVSYSEEATPDLPLRRQRRIPVSGASLSAILGITFVSPGTRFESDLPEGVRFVRWYLDHASDCLMLVVEHESFAEVPEGEKVPLHNPMIVCYPPRE